MRKPLAINPPRPPGLFDEVCGLCGKPIPDGEALNPRGQPHTGDGLYCCAACVARSGPAHRQALALFEDQLAQRWQAAKAGS
jgi:hypothetical protein